MNSTQLLPAIRDLYSRRPEIYHLEPWELQFALFVLFDRPIEKLRGLLGEGVHS